MKIIAATKNKNKLREFGEILKDFEIISQEEAGIDIDVEETGTTFEENSRLKAEAIFKATGIAAIADDSGLCVDFLDGEPGVYSARYSGENATDKKNNQKLLKALEDVPFNERTARFVCVLAVAEPNKETVTYRGECQGYIALKEIGDGGFGYDPLFYVKQYDMTMGELEPHIKNAISHRKNALKKFAKANKKV